MIDIHTHLYFPQYERDREETIRRAFASGVTRMISVGTEPNDWDSAAAIAELDPRITLALGLHPHFFNEQEAGNRERLEWELEELGRAIERHRKSVVAVGECGLDYFSHTGTPITREQKAWQREGWVEQAKLAERLGLPMIIHCRDAYGDMADILKERIAAGSGVKYVLHCYAGDTAETERFLVLPDVFFSFTATITYPVKKDIEGGPRDPKEAVKMIPLERILTETDCPFLAPQAYRGKRNEPSFVSETVAKIAQCKGVEPQAVAESTDRTAGMIFGQAPR